MSSVAHGARHLLGWTTMELRERQAQTLMDTAVDVAMVRWGDTGGRREDSPGVLGLSLVVSWLSAHLF